MKRHFRLNYLLWALALPFIFTSCSDEDDYPDAYFNFEERGGVQHDGALYVQNGDSICFDRISVIKEQSTPSTTITTCDYYWDGFFVGPGFAPDFGRKFFVYGQPAGRHILSIRMLIAAEGYSLATYVSNFAVEVLPDDASLDDITPDNTDLFTSKKLYRTE